MMDAFRKGARLEQVSDHEKGGGKVQMKAMSISIAALALLALGIGGSVALRDSDPRSERPSSQTVSSWPDVVTANGVVEGVRPEAALRPEVSGNIAVVYVCENQEVYRGQLLMELRNATHKHQVVLAEAEVEVAKANRDRLRNGEREETRKAAASAEKAKHAIYLRARLECERQAALMTNKSSSKEQYDASYYQMQKAKADWDQAKAEKELAEAPARADEMAAAEGRIRAAEARLLLAREELEKTRLVAPSNGRILQVHGEPGEWAGPTSAQPMILMANLSKRRVRTFVEELDAARLGVGQKAAVTADGLPGRDFTGIVSELMPRMGRRTPLTDAPGEYRDLYFREVLIDLAAGDELPLNLRVRVRIHTHSEQR